VPLGARLVIAAYVGLYLVFSAAILTASMLLIPFSWVSWALAALLLSLAALLLDAFHPRVSLFIHSWWKIPQQAGKKTIALTFDDGPVDPYTGQILDILDHYKVKASFFCIGENVQQNPELALEIVRRGHTLGNHTQTHRNLMTASPDLITLELEEAQRAILRNCGAEPRFFRPATELVDRVLNRAAAGDIVVMHDGYAPGKPGKRDSLVAALPGIIEGLLARDITPVSLDQAIGKQP
jgi:peptidoglycan/xylan/chitin deacetylase (PgdA/CDA1 family)